MNNLFKKRIVATKAHTDIVFSIVFMLFCLYMLFIGNQKFIKVGFGAVGIVNDRLFPNALMVLGLLISFGILLIALAENARDKKRIAAQKEPATTEFSICALLIGVIGAFFYFTMKVIGYPLSSVISIYAVYYMLGGRKILRGAVVACGFTLVCYLFFAVYLGVNLTLGFGL